MAEQNVTPSALVAAFFTDNFPEKDVIKQVRENNVLLSWLDKDTKCGDEQMVLPLLYGDPQGAGPTRAIVQAIQATTGGGSIRGVKWTIPWGGYKAGFEIKLSDLKLNRNQPMKFLDVQAENYAGTIRTYGDRIETYLWSNSGHSLGSGVFTAATGVIQLADPRDAQNYAPGQQLQISANDGSSSAHTLVAASGIGYVIATNANAGTVTVSATDNGAAGAPANWANATTYHYFNYGDFGGDTSPYRIITGIPAWIPVADPSSTLFNSVNRTINVPALSGCRLTEAQVANKPIDQRLEALVELIDRIGYYKQVGGERAFFVSGTQWLNLKNRLFSMGKLDISEPTAEFGFRAINLVTPKGTVPVYSAEKCPNTGAWHLAKKAMKLYSVGEFPGLVDEDGNRMTRNATDDKFEFRFDGVGEVGIRGPGACGYVPLAA